MINQARLLLREHNSVLVQSPTGSGKTALSAYMVGGAIKKGMRSFFICHRIELIEQTAKTFDLVGIPYGIIAAGISPNPFQPVQICSIDTLKSRVDKIAPPDFCVWDEAHHNIAAGWAKVHDRYSNAKHIGLTATPERLDGKGLKKNFSAMVKGPTVQWLIENGWLSDYKAFAPNKPDLGAVHTTMGDYDKKELALVMDTNTITGDAITHYQRLARDKRAVAFCVNIKHSTNVAAQFRNAGIMAVHIDGTMRRQDRKAAIDAFRAGTIKVICNVNLIGEGFDLPAIESAILLRPTQSLSLYLQYVGRALRPGKPHAIILDHAGNILRHGLPDDERDWSLEGHNRKKSKKTDEVNVSIRQCPKCFFVHKPEPKCPQCGHIYVSENNLPEVTEGELVEINKDEVRRKRFTEQSYAKTLDQLVALGKARGYKNAYKWAAYIITARKAKRGMV